MVKEINKEELAKAATELNEVMGLDPKIDIEGDGVKSDLCEAAIELFEDDEVTPGTQALLAAIGATLPDAWSEAENTSDAKNNVSITPTKKEKVVAKKSVKKEKAAAKKEKNMITEKASDTVARKVIKKEENTAVKDENNTGVSRNDLVAALFDVGHAVDKAFDPNIAVDKDKIVAYNREIEVLRYVDTGITGIIDYEVTRAFINKMSDSKIEIVDNDKSITIKGKNAKAKIQLADHDPQQRIEIPSEDSEWKKLPDDFLTSLHFCTQLKYNILTKEQLAFISIVGNIMYVRTEAIGIKKIMSEGFKDNFFMSVEVAKKLSKCDVDEYYANDKLISFRKKGKIVFSCIRQNECAFPDMENLFVSDKEGIDISRSFFEAVERTSIAIKDDDSEIGITLSVADGQINLNCKTSLCDIKENVITDSAKVNAQGFFNPTLLPKTGDFNKLRVADTLMLFSTKDNKTLYVLAQLNKPEGA